MNTNGLAKLYDKLTPWERVPLIVAAGARGDHEEQNRLTNTAPTHLFEVANYRGLSEALSQLADLHLIMQLDLAVLYWQTAGMLDGHLLLMGAANDERENRLCQTMQLLAYRYVAQADAWHQLCARLQVDPAVLLKDYPGFDNLQRLEEIARRTACSEEEATAMIRQGSGDPDAHVTTAAVIAAAMWKVLEDRAEWWMGTEPVP